MNLVKDQLSNHGSNLTKRLGAHSWKPIPVEGPLGKGPGVGSGRSSEPARGTGQTGKRVGERAPTGKDHGQWGAQQRESV